MPKGIKVTLRQKPISGNRRSLYLDYYPAIINPDTGKPTRREFLGLYIHEPIKYLKRTQKDGTTKQMPVYDNNPTTNEIMELHNENTLATAQQIRLKQDNNYNKSEIYSVFEQEQRKAKQKGEKNFVEYFRNLAKKRQQGNFDNWISAYKYFEEFTDGVLKFEDLNQQVCDNFKDFLLTNKTNRSSKARLSQNSAASYFTKLKAALKQAFRDGYLKTDLGASVTPIKQLDTQRNFLTIDELNRLVQIECRNPLMKRAALFSALTGLRFSDIQKLVWGEIRYSSEEGYSIQFRQKKTKGAEVLPISEQAYNLLGEQGKPDEQVFKGLKYSAYENKHLFQWIGAAGITKDITFHCFRHTYAVLQILNGTDIYTVSKLLGHKDLKTTQIYAKVADQLKREAADKIKLNM